jgi:hypothetical protein
MNLLSFFLQITLSSDVYNLQKQGKEADDVPYFWTTFQNSIEASLKLCKFIYICGYVFVLRDYDLDICKQSLGKLPHHRVLFISKVLQIQHLPNFLKP